VLVEVYVRDYFNPFGQVAQLVEQRTENPRVGGSIPSLAIEAGNELGDSEPPGPRQFARVVAGLAITFGGFPT
jgi:hypothetical protein